MCCTAYAERAYQIQRRFYDVVPINCIVTLTRQCFSSTFHSIELSSATKLPRVSNGRNIFNSYMEEKGEEESERSEKSILSRRRILCNYRAS